MTEPARVTLDDMVGQDELLERFPWLSAQMLNKWLAAGRIRYLHGKSGKIVYPISDMHRAVDAELRIDEPVATQRKPPPSTRDRDQTAEVAEILRRQSLEKIFGKGSVPEEYLVSTEFDALSDMSSFDQIRYRQFSDELNIRVKRGAGKTKKRLSPDPT
ncbi:hypothetical protein ACQZ4Y_20145 [Rhizobium sp. L80/93]|uniref:hypothetical protein n=1 Tax=Rhizobium sp. E27B/91 TaxID=2819995 RepID=UPI001ADB2177|nr:hypothetical protein [Rhizobium sp. E27B/91]MBO9186808.1 hypothetical protein [Rhizobium sp. E27B/91]